MTKRWLVGFLAAALGISGLAQEDQGTWVEVYAHGQLVAQGGLEQASLHQFQAQGEGEVRLNLRGKVYPFILAQMSKTLGETRIWLNGGMVALSRVAAELQAAQEGKKDLAIFWKEDRVVGLVEVNANARVSAEGATQVTLIVNGLERTLQVYDAGSALVEVKVYAEGRVQGLLEVIQGSSRGEGAGGAEGRGQGGVNLRIGIGIGGGR